AAIAAYVIATLFFTSANLIRLSAVGAEITVADAVRTFLFDVRGMAPSLLWTQYASLIFIGFAIAFPVAAVLRRFSMRSEAARWVAPSLYPLAGATAIGWILILRFQPCARFPLAGGRGALGLTAVRRPRA